MDDEEWRELAEAFPDSFLATRWRLYVAWRDLEPQLIAFWGERIYGLLLRLDGWRNKLPGGNRHK